MQNFRKPINYRSFNSALAQSFLRFAQVKLHLAMPPDPRERLRWTSPIGDSVAAILQRKGQQVCVLASGDPLCFGIGVTFPLFQKVDVNGKDAHPLFQYLTKVAPGLFGRETIKWNFTKFLVDRSGKAVERYASLFKPEDLDKAIQKQL